jgi:PrtD family type I secretion system ABC transporter
MCAFEPDANRHSPFATLTGDLGDAESIDNSIEKSTASTAVSRGKGAFAVGVCELAKSSSAVSVSRGALSEALADCRRAFWSVALFSAAVNLLMLAAPLYMLQVYDRVLVSRSVPTLIALSVFLFGAFGFQAILDIIRTRVVVRAAALLDLHLGADVHDAVTRLAIQTRQPGEALQPVRDLDQIRAFLTSTGPIAIVDLPWVPVFLLVCYFIHPLLGITALAGALVMLALTFATEWQSRRAVRESQIEGATRSAMIEATRRNGETVAAMGMGPALAARWSNTNQSYLSALQRTSDVVSTYGSLSRVFRFALQSAILGLGAYLVIHEELMAGAMIAASVMTGRALAPIETAIANWRGFVSARDSTRRLRDILRRFGDDAATTQLPGPHRTLSVAGLTIVPPGAAGPTVSDIAFSLSAGEGLGIIGPSGSGKTSLVRTLVGVWAPARGTVRVDGATLDQWKRGEFGRHVGYMAQTLELFDGTVAENISRMRTAPAEVVIRAAEAAGAHEMILRLPRGYETRIGDGGSMLSAGQRQRIALARALFGDPFLVVLDEPNANLDPEGDIALDQATRGARARGAIVVIVAHRPSVLSACDKVLVLNNGVQQAFGPRDEIMRRSITKQTAIAGQSASLRVVGEPQVETV